MSEEEMKGKAEKAKGTVREEIGKATGNEKEQIKGNLEKGEGEIRDKVGKADRKMNEADEEA